MTELQKLKAKCYNSDGSPKIGATQADFARYKQLQDGEPLSKADLENAKKREDERAVQDKKDFDAKQQGKIDTAATKAVATALGTPEDQDAEAQRQDAAPTPTAALDQPAEHPRITVLKDALRVFTQIEAHDSRPDDFVLFTRDVSITAGDVRRARRAMKI